MTVAPVSNDPRLEWFKPPTYRRTEGRLRWARRLENTRSRNAEFNVMVTESPTAHGPEYIVERSYGPIGAPSHHSTVTTTGDLMGALHQARSIVRGKTAKRDYDEKVTWEDLSDAPEMVDSDPDTWEVAEEYLGPSKEPVPAPQSKPPTRECECTEMYTQLAGTKYTDSLEGTLEVAPMFEQAQSAMMEFPEQVGARWLVGVYAACAPGYPHARAIPIGPEMKGSNIPKILQRNAPEWVEDVVMKHLRPDHIRRLKSFGLLVEEAGADIIALDIVYGLVNEKQFDNGKSDMVEDAEFKLRRSFLNEVWAQTFNETNALRLVPLLTARLREEFLADEGGTRFELVNQTDKLPLRTVRLPVLKN